MLVDRTASAVGESWSNQDGGGFVRENIDASSVTGHAKFSFHTTGIVNYYPYRKKLQSRTRIKRLLDLTEFVPVAIYSVPSLERLDQRRDHALPAVAIDCRDYTAGRITFIIEMGPAIIPPNRDSVVFQLNHRNIYSAVIRLASHPQGSAEISEHFIIGLFGESYPDASEDEIISAEIEFNERAYPEGPPIFRKGDGSYFIIGRGRMRTAPKLIVKFDRDDLRSEVIPISGEPTHKVNFWILDRGGRNKRDDLRPHILNLFFDARM
jgi:hypothetical protein